MGDNNDCNFLASTFGSVCKSTATGVTSIAKILMNVSQFVTDGRINGCTWEDSALRSVDELSAVM